METILNNKRFIKVSIIFMVLLSLLTLAKFINAMKMDDNRRGTIPPNTITVTGTGDVMAVSDIASINLNISKDGATTKEAQDALNTAVTKTLAYLKGQKIDDKDIKSEYGGVNPKYSNPPVIQCFAYPCPQPNAKITGYTANQSITVKVRAIDSANDVRTGLANLGITDINGPTFSIDSEDVYKDQARAKAIDNAKEKASTLAKQLGVRLGHVTNFSENNNGGPIMYATKGMALGSAAPTAAPAPVLPTGQNKITSDVTITYEIK